MTTSTNQSLSEVVESKIMQNNQPSRSLILSWCLSQWRNIASEFLATMMLVSLGCMSGIPLKGYDSPVIPALAIGMIVVLNVQIFAHVSGAHMNPAVTLAYVIWGGISIPVGIVYFIAQCAGAIAGYGILDALTSMDLSEKPVCVTSPHPSHSAVQGFGVELAITIALILFNCAIWDPVNKDKIENVSVKFGLIIVGLSVVAGPLTGASMNPARSLGPAVWTNIWTHHWVYWAAPFSASVIGVVLYKTFLTSKEMREIK